MKPIGTNNLSALGYIGLFILFCMPYIGTPALILFAIFGRGEARNFARAILLITVIMALLVVVLTILGLFNLGDFNFSVDNGFEMYNNLRTLIG